MDLECVDMFSLMTVPPSVFYQKSTFSILYILLGSFYPLSATAWYLFGVTSLLRFGLRSIGILHLLV